VSRRRDPRSEADFGCRPEFAALGPDLHQVPRQPAAAAAPDARLSHSSLPSLSCCCSPHARICTAETGPASWGRNSQRASLRPPRICSSRSPTARTTPKDTGSHRLGAEFHAPARARGSVGAAGDETRQRGAEGTRTAAMGWCDKAKRELAARQPVAGNPASYCKPPRALQATSQPFATVCAASRVNVAPGRQRLALDGRQAGDLTLPGRGLSNGITRPSPLHRSRPCFNLEIGEWGTAILPPGAYGCWILRAPSPWGLRPRRLGTSL
jgi:hypothetical protein